ncbi:hypothetical protein KO361_05480 [Candidatus Woesearchaeota archaeon]|nr:hypothetical protein [Candidatus Woesearchaeota archaeon]
MKKVKITEETFIEITNKKELRGINKEIIRKIIQEHKKQNETTHKKLEQNNYNKKSKEYLTLKKYVRKRLRELHGVFQKNKLSPKKQEDLLKNKDFNFHSEKTQKFLKSHRSTKERLNNYETLYTELEKEKPITTLADLGCGLNPLSYSLLKKLRNCFCTDINEEEINFLNKYFEKTPFKGEAQTLDLTKEETLKIINNKTKKTTHCFLFKVLDGLESIQKNISKTIIKNINSETIIISFSKTTISGKKITSERKWFKKILDEQKQQGTKITFINLGNEEYHILNKP